MKKTLAALAILGAFAGTAAAADVTLYGVVDYGFNYQHVDGDVAGTDASDSFTMKSGQNSGSRFGLKGEEDLGNGTKVGFVLENGFDADDGTFDSNGDRMFGREAQLYVQGNFGKLGFGRAGQFASALGSYGLLGQTSPFSAGWGSFTGQKFVQAAAHTRYDNMVTYQTPTFAGFQVSAQYSFGNTDATKGAEEGKASANRYYALAATYKAQNLYIVGIVDSINYGSKETTVSAGANAIDDSLTFTLGGNYDFGVAKVYAVGQYFDNVLAVGQGSNIGTDNTVAAKLYKFPSNAAEGWDLALGVGVPCFGGTAKAHVGYVSAEDTKDSDYSLDRWNVSVGYDYSLSKRTSVYTAATYLRDSLDSKTAADERDPSAVEFMVGMIHKF